jgi:mRNA-degrading endonuclease RelE of RelBE toxin-antitoxin system
MRFRVELSREAQKQLSRFPRDVRERMERAIDELKEKDDSQWKGRLCEDDPPRLGGRKGWRYFNRNSCSFSSSGINRSASVLIDKATF